MGQEHNSVLYGQVPLTTQARAAVRAGPLNRIITWLEVIAAAISVVIYVISTYNTSILQHTRTIEMVLVFFFVATYILKVYSAPIPLYYVFSVNGLVDLINIVPIVLLWRHSRSRSFGLEILLFLRVFRILPGLTSLGLLGATVEQRILRLIAYVLGVVFIAAGIFQWVEFQATPPHVKAENKCGAEGCLTFSDSLYFIFVSITTVGYGDITPNSSWGRWVAVLAIIAAFVILPVHINKILQLASRRPIGGKFTAGRGVGFRFIIVSGNLSYRTVQDFLAEFYHPNHDKDMPGFPLRVVLMAPFKPSFELKMLLAQYKRRVRFFEGTPMKAYDLDRVSAKKALGIFLLADQRAEDPDSEDAVQIVRTLSVHRHCGSQVRLIVELLKPENNSSAIWDDTEGDIEIVCQEAIRFRLLSRSCQIKGLSTFLINLFRSGFVISKPEQGSWLWQYCHGLQQEVFPVLLPACFHEQSLLFDEAALIVYQRFGVVLFGLDIAGEDEVGREISVYPKNRTILPSDVGIVIAKNLQVAQMVSKFGKSYHMICRRKFCVSIFQFDCPTCRAYSQDISLLKQVVRKKDTDYQSAEVIQRDIDSSVKPQPIERGQLRANNFASISPRERTRHVMTQDENSQEMLLLEDIYMGFANAHKDRMPDSTTLERKAGDIMECLKSRTLSAVKFEVPHILLCIAGRWPQNLFYFVAHTRSSVFPTIPVVILHANEPTSVQWGSVGMFEEVYIVKGSPVYEADLVRAGVREAEKVVILTNRNRSEAQADAANAAEPPASSYAQDVNNVVITASVERLLRQPRGRVIVELQQESDLHFLRPKIVLDQRQFNNVLYRRNTTSTFQLAPAYVEGKAFCPQSLGFLMYATFYNRSTTSLVEQFIAGDSWKPDAERGERERSTLASLHQTPIPDQFVSRSFAVLFIWLLQNKQAIALGLYRPVGTDGSIVSYVYTNPAPSQILVIGDLVYVLK